MIALASEVRILLFRHPTDMRKNFHGLVALVESAMNEDPLSGSLFVFVNRRRDRMKILCWVQSGFCIWYQQLQQGTYQLPKPESLGQEDTLVVTRSQLSLILDGIDLSSVRQRSRFKLNRTPPRGD